MAVKQHSVTISLQRANFIQKMCFEFLLATAIAGGSANGKGGDWKDV
jgi:hypothetical protein